MARAHFVKKARKDQPGGIKAGDSYYWWKFRHGGKHYSKTHPRPSQLTRSEYLSSAYGLQEQIEDMGIDPGDLQAAADELRSVADEIRNVGQEQEDKIDNMPDSLQESQTAEMMRGRAEACENLAGELESVHIASRRSRCEDRTERTTIRGRGAGGQMARPPKVPVRVIGRAEF